MISAALHVVHHQAIAMGVVVDGRQNIAMDLIVVVGCHKIAMDLIVVVGCHKIAMDMIVVGCQGIAIV